MEKYRDTSLALWGLALWATLSLGWSAPAAAGDAAAAVAEMVAPDAEVEACEQDGRRVRIVVENVRNAAGIVTAELYRDAKDGFLKKRGRLDRMRVAAQAGETRLCLLPPESGSYAVAVFHDENADKEFNRDFLGIPSEGYGFSNNPGFRFGLPEMHEIRITVDDRPLVLSIQLTYF
jgi:uncharacterized protein (DUF2141 family)